MSAWADISIKCQMDCGDVGSLISIGGVIERLPVNIYEQGKDDVPTGMITLGHYSRVFDQHMGQAP